MSDDLHPVAVNTHHIKPYPPVETVVTFQVKKSGFDYMLFLLGINGMKGVSEGGRISFFHLYKYEVIFLFSNNIYLAEAGPVIPLYDPVSFLF